MTGALLGTVSLVQVVPPSVVVVMAAPLVRDEEPVAVHDAEEEHEMEERETPRGTVSLFQVKPPSVVITTGRRSRGC